MQTFLVHLTRTILKAPRVTLGLIVLSVVIAVGFTALNLTFKTERSDLIDPEAVFHRRWIRYTESFGDGSDLVVTVEAEQPELIKEVLDKLGERLSRQPEYFSSVFYKVDPQGLRQKGLQFLSPEQLREGLEMLSSLKPILAGRWEEAGIKTMGDQLSTFFAGLQYIPHSEDRQQQVLGQADRLTSSLSAAIQGSDDFVPPWPEFVTVKPQLKQEGDKVVYLLSRNGKMGFLKAFPVKQDAEFGGAIKSIDRMRGELASMKKAYPQVRFGLTGIPVLEADEMSRSQRDTMISSVVSFIGVGLILVLGFHGVIHTLLCLGMLAVGMCWSFAFATATIGHLNILSVSFAAILIGLGIDFAIHYLSHYLDLRHHNIPVKRSLIKTTSTIGAGVVTAAITTSLAFFCACLTEFLGIAELGIIAGGGIMLCMICSFIVNPTLIYFADRNTKPKQLPTPFQAKRLRELIGRYPRTMALGSMFLAISLCFQIIDIDHGQLGFGLKYDPNLLNLQADGLDSVAVQKRIATETDESLLFAVSIANSVEETKQLAEEFRALPSVQHVEELSRYLPENSNDETRLLVQAYHSYVEKLPAMPQKVMPVDPASVGQSLEQLYKQVKVIPGPQAAEVTQNLDRILDWLEALPLNAQLGFLQDYEYRMRMTIFNQLEELHTVSDPTPVTLADLPESLVRRFVSPQGEWLMQIFPKKEIWDDEPLEEFVTQLRTIDPEVTGTPLQNYEASQQIQTSYLHSSIYALLCITCVLLIDFCDSRRIWLILSLPFLLTSMLYAYADTVGHEYHLSAWVLVMESFVCFFAILLDRRGMTHTILAMLPPVVGMFMLFGGMSLLSINFNPANMIVLPLILGIGVDVGVHIVHDYLHQQGPYKTSGSTMNAIFLTSMTTMMGFGSMIIAAHRGLSSLGMVLTLGVACCLFVGMIPLPAFLTLLGRGRTLLTEDQEDAVEPSSHRSEQTEPVAAGANTSTFSSARHIS